MARRRKKITRFFNHLKEETVQAVLSIMFFALSFFLVFGNFNKAGIVGEKLYSILSNFLGIGYFLLPILLIALGVHFLRSEEKGVMSIVQVLGSLLFLSSGLAIIEILMEGEGGLIGSLMSVPMLKMFDVYASLIILGSLLLISIVIIFDITLKIDLLNMFKKISSLFTRKKKEKEIEFKEDSVEEEEEENYSEDEDKETGGEEPEKKKLKLNIFKDEKIDSLENSLEIKSLFMGMSEYNAPPLTLVEGDKGKPGVGDIKANANIIKRTLQNFGINVEMDEISIGPTVTRYALKPAEGVKLSRIVGLQNDLALSLAAHPIRIEAPIPGKSLVGIEIPNSTKTTVGLGSLLKSEDFKSAKEPLMVSLGRGITGKSHFANLAKMPHILIAGTTGSGKSVTIHSIITSLLYRNSPDNMKMIMIDPKRVELTLYNKTPHLLTPVITDAKKAILALRWAAKEMERRYDVLESESVRDIGSYHKNILEPELKKAKDSKENEEHKLPEPMPYIVIILDELADIMTTYPRELEAAIVRLAQMSRAVGIHLILSTQRPSVNVITGLIKANIPARIALQVSSQIDSRTILDTSGAEKLLGAGDMLYISGEMSKPARIQSSFISENEVKKVVKYIYENNTGDPMSTIDFSEDSNKEKNSIFDAVGNGNFDDGDDDELYEEAREEVMKADKASTSYLQRKLRIGYARAARLMDMLEERGVIGPGEGSKPREVLDKYREDEKEDQYDK